MQHLTYFHAKPTGRPHRWTRKPLKHQPSFHLTYTGARDVLALAHLRDGGPTLDHWPTVLDEALVALIYIEDDDLASALDGAVERTGDALPVVRDAALLPLDPGRSRMVGLAFVKAVAVEQGNIELVSPAAAEVFGLCERESDAGGEGEAEMPRLVLLMGWYDAPVWAYTGEVRWQRECERRKRRRLLETRPELTEEVALAEELRGRVGIIEQEKGGVERVGRYLERLRPGRKGKLQGPEDRVGG